MNRLLPRGVLLLVGLGLAFAVWRLLDLRFSTGDVYPPSSTFRADPLGARAYFDGLSRLPGRQVSRLLEPVRRLGNGAKTTLFLLGCDPQDTEWLNSRNAGELDDFLAQGGRIVITLDERQAADLFPGTNAFTAPAVAPGTTNAWQPRRFTLANHWHFGLAAAPTTTAGETLTNSYAVPATAAATAGLPRELCWHSALRLASLGTNWTALYADAHGPVLAAKAVGPGSLIVATGARFHGNAALREERETALLAWLPGPSTRLVFDETHLGTELNPGIMTLARRYRLHGLGLGLLLLAALFIWQQASTLVPRRPISAEAAEPIAAHAAADGFVNLLRRAVPASELAAHCFQAWRESAGRTRPDLAPRVTAMQDLVNLENARPPKERNPVEVYRRLTEILNRR